MCPHVIFLRPEVNTPWHFSEENIYKVGWHTPSACREGPTALSQECQGHLTTASQVGSMVAHICTPSLRLTPRVRGLDGWGPGRWSVEPKGTRDSQNSWCPAPLLNHLGVVACKKHRIGNMDFFHIFMKFILLGSFGQMSLQSRPSVFIVFFSWAEPPEDP